MALAAAAAAAVVLLALWRVDVAVIVGVLLLGVVRVEPSPSDAFFSVAMLVVVLTRRHELHRVPRWAAAGVAVLVVANLVSLMNAPGARSGVTYFAVTLYLLALALWLAAYVDRTSRARAIVIALTVAAVTSAILGSLAVLAPIPGRDLFVFKGCCRAQGLFKDPNVFGPFLIPPMLILLHEALYPRLFSRRSRPLIVGCIVILMLGIILSFSRGAWLNLAVGVGVMAAALCLRPGGIRRVAGLVAILALVAAAVIVALNATGETSYFDERAGLQTYDMLRFGVRDEGLKMALRTPLGLGPGQFEEYFVAFPHNVYVFVAAEQGALGILAFLGLVLGTLAMAARSVWLGRDTHGIGSAALLGSWAGLIASGMFVDTLHWRHMWVVAALVWAAAPVRVASAVRVPIADRWRRLPTVAAASGVLAAMLLVVVAVLWGAPSSSRAVGTVAGGTGRAGDVRFMAYPDSSADRFFTTNRYADFMNRKYWRVRSYTPFFDQALPWYPNAWFYQDVQAIYPGSTEARAHPEWILRDGDGRPLYVPWGCSRGTCPQYAADIGDPAFRSAWLQEAERRLARGYRGIYVDDVNLTLHVGDGREQARTPIDDRTGKPMTLEAWKGYMVGFVEAIRRRFPDVEIVHNVMWHLGASDPAARRQIAAADFINVERGVNDDGLTGGSGEWSVRGLLSYADEVHAQGRAVMLQGRAETDAAREYNLAAYFLVSTGRDAVGNLDGGTPTDWWPGYDVRLGAPVAPRAEWSGVLRRDFARGMVLLNEPGGTERIVDVGPGYTRIGGQPAQQVTLPPASGVVLLRG